MKLGIALFCLCCLPCHVALADPGAAPVPPVVRTQAAWQQVLASGAPTPLDALTPYGRQRFIDSLRWGERGLGGFNPAPLVRELDLDQLDAVLRFLDLARYQPMLARDIAGAPLRLPPPSSGVVQDLQQLERFAAQDGARRRDANAAATAVGSPAVLRRYQALFGARMGAAAIHAQPLGELLPLFDAAALAANGNPDTPALEQMLLVQRELAARGVDTRRTLDQAVLGAMLAARRFEQARAFAAARPHLARQAIPAVEDDLGPGYAGRSVYDYDAASNTLRRAALPYPAGTELVVVVGGACHFSQNALQAIAADAAFQARLRGASLTLVTPPRAPIDFGFIANWNAAHPTLPIRIPAGAQAWQAVDVPDTPEFYLLRDGERIGKVGGWPDAGNQAAVLGMLDQP